MPSKWQKEDVYVFVLAVVVALLCALVAEALVLFFRRRPRLSGSTRIAAHARPT